ncbi:MAG: hypothetical protein M3270_11350 [Thermoproteota archaeon]|nr:hypothetical protein [Thermoproteota archaeon]
MGDKIEIQKIRRLSELVERYTWVLNQSEAIVYGGLLGQGDSRAIPKWLSEQDAIREEIRHAVSQIQNDLGYQNEKIQMLWTRLAS